MKLYHGTSVKVMENIIKHGLRPMSSGPNIPTGARPLPAIYLTDDLEVAWEFCRTAGLVEKCNEVVCEVDLDDLDRSEIMPDWNMVADPTNRVLDLVGCSPELTDNEAECWAQHLAVYGPDDDGDWDKSLKAAHSIAYLKTIPPTKLRCEVVGDRYGRSPR